MFKYNGLQRNRGLILFNTSYVYLSRTGDNAWSGLHYNNATSRWEFTDGSIFVSFSLGNDDLNGIDGDNPVKCATFNTKRMNDRSCAVNHRYVCSYPGFTFSC